jgi:hypothetical protein
MKLTAAVIAILAATVCIFATGGPLVSEWLINYGVQP